jgi:hypothetical protein
LAASDFILMQWPCRAVPNQVVNRSKGQPSNIFGVIANRQATSLIKTVGRCPLGTRKGTTGSQIETVEVENAGPVLFSNNEVTQIVTRRLRCEWFDYELLIVGTVFVKEVIRSLNAFFS